MMPKQLPKQKTLWVHKDGSVTLGQKGPTKFKIEKPSSYPDYMLSIQSIQDPNDWYLVWTGTAKECISWLCGWALNSRNIKDVDWTEFKL